MDCRADPLWNNWNNLIANPSSSPPEFATALSLSRKIEETIGEQSEESLPEKSRDPSRFAPRHYMAGQVFQYYG